MHSRNLARLNTGCEKSARKMPPSSILLKIKGSAGLKQTASLETEDELRKAWRVCTRVKDGLENGLRLENLSWRLWHLHNKLLRS